MTSPQEAQQYDEHFKSKYGSNEQPFRPTLTKEELRVLKECNIESFYFRCVPFAAILTTGAYFAMRKGILKTSERFGYTPKMLVAGVLGYIFGKFSYQTACAEKIMRLPNSHLAETLRKHKGRAPFQESIMMDPAFITSRDISEEKDSSEASLYDDFRFRSDVHNDSFDEYQKVQDSLTEYTTEDSQAVKEYTNYRDLKRQNREEYIARMSEQYKRQSALSEKNRESKAPPEQSVTIPEKVESHKAKNKYGDVWD